MVISRQISAEERRRLAGEAIEIIRLGSFPKPTFFCEDNYSVQFLKQLARYYNLNIAVSKCGGKANVLSLFQLAESQGGWNSVFFIRDGDNEKSPAPGHDNFIHLDKYCIESYLLDTKIAALLSNKHEDEIRQTIVRAIIRNKQKVFKSLDFLADHLNAEQLSSDNLSKLDASQFVWDFVNGLGMERDQYVRQYIAEAFKQGEEECILPKKLIQIMRNMRSQQLLLGVELSPASGAGESTGETEAIEDGLTEADFERVRAS